MTQTVCNLSFLRIVCLTDQEVRGTCCFEFRHAMPLLLPLLRPEGARRPRFRWLTSCEADEADVVPAVRGAEEFFVNLRLPRIVGNE